jgi:hypothetical protein
MHLNISEPLPSPHLLTNRYSPVQPSLSSQKLPKHPLFGLWNPVWQAWLVSDVQEVSDDSEIWTETFDHAQIFRTEAAAQVARMHLRDFYAIDTAVCVLGYG